MGITQAIAAIIAGGAAELERDPAEFRHRHDLTPAELDALRRASPHGFRLAHNEHRTARLETLQAILPRTLRLLRPTPSAVLGPYLDQVPWRTTTIQDEAHRFLLWLKENDALDPPLSDLAAYESMLHELAEDPAASQHARRPAGPPLAPSDRPTRSPAARTAGFTHDVTATPPTPLPHPLHLLAVKTPERWGPRIYRLSDQAVRILHLCTGERSLTEVISLSTNESTNEAEATATVAHLIAHGALTSQPVA